MIDGIKVFSATKHAARASLGDLVTAWLRETQVDVVEKWVKQSSDHEFHCVSIVIAYKLPKEVVSGNVPTMPGDPTGS